MFISNGIAYAKKTADKIFVTDAKALNDGMLLLTFNTDEMKLFDSTTLVGPVFKPLSDPAIFSNITIEYGVVTWCNGDIDCSPEFMYQNSYSYNQDYVIEA